MDELINDAVNTQKLGSDIQILCTQVGQIEQRLNALEDWQIQITNKVLNIESDSLIQKEDLESVNNTVVQLKQDYNTQQSQIKWRMGIVGLSIGLFLLLILIILRFIYI